MASSWRLAVILFLAAIAIALVECAGKQLPVQDAIRREHSPNGNKYRKFVQQFRQISPLLGPLDSNVNCDLCKIIVTLVRVFAETNRTSDDIEKLSDDICILDKIEDKSVCRQIVAEFQTEVLYVADNLVLDPSEICGLLYGSSCAVFYNPYANWTIPLPPSKPPVVPPVPPKADSPVLRILHLTDIHLDLEYKEGLNTDCGEPICCRANNGPPKPGVPGAGKWGDYRDCDLPLETLVNFFQHLAKTQNQFDIVYWTGDLPAHNVWNQSRADQLHHQDLFMKLYRQYVPNKPLYPCVGNHESAPVNSYPPPFITGDNSMDWLYQDYVDTWGLPPDTKSDIMRGGYYTVSPYPGFRIISLNDNYCNNMNWWLLLNTTDPANQLSWLVDVLTAAEKNKEKVHILTHIPTADGCLKTWSWNFYDIINRFESTVTAQFFGHTHSDQYHIVYDNVEFTRPISVQYVGGSLTPQSDMNPGYRIYLADGNYAGSSWQILDHTNYILNLTQANNDGPVSWDMEYSAKAAYEMDSLYPADWDKLIGRMAANKYLFNLYYKHYKKSNVHPGECEDDNCRQGLLCNIQCARSNDEDNLCRNRTVTAADILNFKSNHVFN